MAQPGNKQFWYVPLPSGTRLKFSYGELDPNRQETWSYVHALIARDYPADAQKLGIKGGRVNDPLSQTGLNIKQGIGGLINSAEGIVDKVTGDTSAGDWVGDEIIQEARDASSVNAAFDAARPGLNSWGEAFGELGKSAPATGLALAAGYLTGGLGFWPALLAAGGTEALLSAGDQYHTQRQLTRDVYNEDPEKFRQLPAFQEWLTRTGGDEQKALDAFATAQGDQSALVAGGANMLTTVALGPLAKKFVSPVLGSLYNKVDDALPVTTGGIMSALGPTKKAVGTIAGSAASEGLEESIQSGAEAFAGNLSARNIMPDIGLWDGVPEAAVTGGITGALGGGMFGAAGAALEGRRRADLNKKITGQENIGATDAVKLGKIATNKSLTEAAADQAATRAGEEAVQQFRQSKVQPPAALLPYDPNVQPQRFDRPDNGARDVAQRVAQARQNLPAGRVEIPTTGKNAKSETRLAQVKEAFESIVGRSEAAHTKAGLEYDAALAEVQEVQQKIATKPRNRQALYARRLAVATKKLDAARGKYEKASQALNESTAKWNEFAGTATLAVDPAAKAAAAPQNLALPKIDTPTAAGRSQAPFTGPIDMPASFAPKTFLDNNLQPEPSYQDGAVNEARDQAADQLEVLRQEAIANGTIDQVGHLIPDPRAVRPDQTPYLKNLEPTPNNVDPAITGEEGVATYAPDRYGNYPGSAKQEFDLSDDVGVEVRRVSSPTTAAGMQPLSGDRVNPPSEGWQAFRIHENLDGQQTATPVGDKYQTREEAESWVNQTMPGRGINQSPDLAQFEEKQRMVKAGDKLAEDIEEERVRGEAYAKRYAEFMDDLSTKVQSIIADEIRRVGLGGKNLKAGRFKDADEAMANIMGQFAAKGPADSPLGVISLTRGLVNPAMSDQEMLAAVRDVFTHELTHALVRGGLITPAEYTALEKIVRKRKMPGENGSKGPGGTYYDAAKYRYAQAPALQAMQSGQEFLPPPDALIVEEAIAELIRMEGSSADFQRPMAPESRGLISKLFNLIKAMIRAFTQPDMTQFYDLVEDIHSGKMADRVIDQIGFDPALPRDPLGRNLEGPSADMKLVFPPPQRNMLRLREEVLRLKDQDQMPKNVGFDPVTGTMYVAVTPKGLITRGPGAISRFMKNGQIDWQTQYVTEQANEGLGVIALKVDGGLNIGSVLDLTDVSAVNPELAKKIAGIPIVGLNMKGTGGSPDLAGGVYEDMPGFMRVMINGAPGKVIAVDPTGQGIEQTLIHEITHIIQGAADSVMGAGSTPAWSWKAGPGKGAQVQSGSMLERSLSDTANFMAAAANDEMMQNIKRGIYTSPMSDIMNTVNDWVADEVQATFWDNLLADAGEYTEDATRSYGIFGDAMTLDSQDAAMRQRQADYSNVSTENLRDMYRALREQHGDRYAPFIALAINNRAAMELFGYLTKAQTYIDDLAAKQPTHVGSELAKILTETSINNIAQAFGYDVYFGAPGEQAARYSESSFTNRNANPADTLRLAKPGPTNKRSAELTEADMAQAFPDPARTMSGEALANLEQQVEFPAVTADQALERKDKTATANMQLARKATPAELSAAIIKLAPDHTVAEMSEILGKSPSTIRNEISTLRAMGHTIQPKEDRKGPRSNGLNFSPAQQAVLRLWDDHSVDEIARIAGVTKEYVYGAAKFLRGLGFDLPHKNSYRPDEQGRTPLSPGQELVRMMRMEKATDEEIAGTLAEMGDEGASPEGVRVHAYNARKKGWDVPEATRKTPVRKDIAELMDKGLSNAQIAERLGITRGSVGVQKNTIKKNRAAGKAYLSLSPGRFLREHRETVIQNMDRYRKASETAFTNSYTSLHRSLARIGVKNPSEFIRNMTDSAIGLAELAAEVEKRGGTVTAETDPYLQEDLFRSLAKREAEQLDEQLFEPFFEAAVNIDMDEAAANRLIEASDIARRWFEGQREKGVKNNGYMASGLYLLAKHAPERNAFVRARRARPAELMDGGPELGIGMSDAEAQVITNWFEQNVPHDRLARILQTSQDVSQRITAIRKEAGLIPADTPNRFRYYVPARGFGEFDAEDGAGFNLSTRTGSRGNIRGREDPRIRGREELPDDPILNLGLMLRQAVVRKHKNKVLQSMKKLIEQNADALRQGEFVAEIVDKPVKDDPAFLTGKEDGKEFHIELGPNFINIAKHLNPSRFTPSKIDHLVAATNIIAPVMRFLTGMITRHNPAFILANLPRDIQTGALNIEGYAKDSMGEYMRAIPGAAPQIISAVTGKNYNSEWGRVVQEYLEEGGDQDLFLDQDPNTLAQDFANRVQEYARGSEASRTGALNATKRTIQKLTEVVDSMNNAAELVSRVVAYRIVKDRSLAEGLPEADARQRGVQAGRNLTVNFNKSGALGKGLNQLYMFWNASVGGTAQIVKAAANSKKVQASLGAIGALGFLMPTILRAMMGDEYDRIPEWVKDRNFIIPTGAGGYLKIPLPYGYSWFYTAGRVANDTIYKAQDPDIGIPGAMQWGSFRVMDSFMNNWSPFGTSGDVGTMIAPTLADPVLELYMNKDFSGMPIMPEPGMRDYDRQSQRYWDSTNPIFVEISDFLSAATGGEGRREGLIEISPNALEYATEFALGGVGKLINQTAVTAESLMTTGSLGEINSVPFARTFVGSATDKRGTSVSYAEMQDRVKTIDLEIKDLIKAGNRADAQERMQRFQTERRMIPVFAAAERQITKLNEQKRFIENKARNSRNGLTPFERRRLEQIEDAKRKVKSDAMAKAESMKAR